MNLEEHAAKALVLAPAGVAVPRGRLRANTGEAAAEIGSCVVEENPASRRSCTATGRDREICTRGHYRPESSSVNRRLRKHDRAYRRHQRPCIGA